MVFKLSVAFVALAALANAATVKRVACPDGKNFASNAAVRLLSNFSFILPHSSFLPPVLPLLRTPG